MSGRPAASPRPVQVVCAQSRRVGQRAFRQVVPVTSQWSTSATRAHHGGSPSPVYQAMGRQSFLGRTSRRSFRSSPTTTPRLHQPRIPHLHGGWLRGFHQGGTGPLHHPQYRGDARQRRGPVRRYGSTHGQYKQIHDLPDGVAVGIAGCGRCGRERPRDGLSFWRGHHRCLPRVPVHVDLVWAGGQSLHTRGHGALPGQFSIAASSCGDPPGPCNCDDGFGVGANFGGAYTVKLGVQVDSIHVEVDGSETLTTDPNSCVASATGTWTASANLTPSDCEPGPCLVVFETTDTGEWLAMNLEFTGTDTARAGR